MKTWNVNLNGYLSWSWLKEKRIDKIFYPSTLQYSARRPRQNNTPGNTRHCRNHLGFRRQNRRTNNNYYNQKYGVDVPRYPHYRVSVHPPAETTDYAAEIFHYALKEQKYTCFLAADTTLPMIYMPDAIRATIEPGKRQVIPSRFEPVIIYRSAFLRRNSRWLPNIPNSPSIMELTSGKRSLNPDSKIIDDTIARNNGNGKKSMTWPELPKICWFICEVSYKS